MLKLRSFIICMLAVFLAATTMTQAQAPTLNIPANGDNCVAKNALFGWTFNNSGTITGTVSYKLQVSTSSVFSGTLVHDVQQAPPADGFTSNTLSYGTQYWWRVGQIYSSDPSTTYYSFSNSFTTKAAPPVALTPAPSNCNPLSNTFTWSNVAGATSYLLQVSETSDFSATVASSTYSNTFGVASVPKNLTNYFWRVRASVGTCVTDWSSSNSFTTIIGSPSATFPSNFASSVPLSVDLAWAPLNGATSYDVEVSTSPTFSNSTTFGQLVTPTVNFTSSSFNTQYYWRVRATDANCTSAWSNSFTFRTTLSSTTLTAPATGASCVSLTPTLTWGSVAGALRYQVQVASAPSFLPVTIEYDNFSTTPSKQVVLANPSSTYYWRVRANDSLNTGDWSSNKYFITTINAPAPSAPVDALAGAPMVMEFKFQNLGQITSMILQVSTDPNFATTVSSTTASTPSRTITLTNYNTTHYWRVKSILTPCESDWSRSRSFTTILGHPLLTTPINNATKQPLEINFSWEPVTGALAYDIELSKSGTFTTLPLLSRSDVPNNNISLKTFEQNTTYQWRVRTRASNGLSPWSPIRVFTTGAAGAAIPALLSPANNTKKIAIDTRLAWSKSPKALRYRLQLTDDVNFNNVIKDTLLGTVNDTTFKTNDLKFFTNHWWRVSAINDSGATAFSDPYTFRTIAFAPTDAALLTAPKQDTTLYIRNNVYFKWNAVPRTTEYYTLSSPDGGYEMSIATDANFSSTFYNSRTVWNTESMQSGFNENTTYFWRVRGWNEAGNGPWSQVSSFKIGPISSVNLDQYNFEAQVNPTPAIENTQLSFTLPNDGIAKVTILDNSGRLVRTLANQPMSQGKHSIDIITSGLSSGSYFFNIEFDNKYQFGQFVITK